MKQRRVDTSRELLKRIFHDGLNFFKRIITGDETWLYFYDPETKQQSSVWKKPENAPLVKARPSKSEGKIMAITFFDAEGIVYRHLVPNNQTVNGTYYVSVLKNLVDAVRRKRPRLNQVGWRILHDNAPCHASNVAQEFLQRNNIEQLSHPPYSPDLAPSDFWPFPILKKPLKGRRFQSANELDNASGDVLRQL